jgi:hypothetical protein
MELVLNLLALAATLAIAYMSAVQGAYRAGMTLAACLVAGAVALGLFGPLAGLLPVQDPERVWYYVGDAIALWAVFALVFLGLRTLGERLLPAQPEFPLYASRIGGGVLGLATGYVCVGACLLLLQMMPMSPHVLGGYSPLRYNGRTNAVEPGDRLWLAWDRGVLTAYEYLLSGPLGAGAGGPCARYGDLYPPDEMRMPAAPVEGAPAGPRPGEAGAAAGAPRRAKLPGENVVDADDFLYYHWYRRYQYIKWRTGHSEGPVPKESALEARLPGMRTQPGTKAEQHGLAITVRQRTTDVRLRGFPDVRIDDSEYFILLDVQFKPPGAALPQTVRSESFALLDRQGRRYSKPLVWGRARRVGEKTEWVPGDPRLVPSDLAPQGTPRFAFAGRATSGDFLLDGAAFTFRVPQQEEARRLVFIAPKSADPNQLRLVYEP